ncbi:zinc finger, C3HC4 type family protein [Salix suchowensis]|nr:zinc finger, C3HC4 type family protein [Salix suchowensis]KAG5248239.1 zinc finger, C3HC4 type family protein [Salix suchowensis]
MISILAQERLLGAALGAAFAGFIVHEQRKRIYQSISPEHPQFQLREPIFGKQFRSEFALAWNKAVDQTFGPVVASLNSRRR